jgi:ribonuclease J
MEKDEPVFDHRYHASGHASGEDIRWVIEQVQPEYIVPVHTENKDWFDRNFENVVLAEEGKSHNL